MTDSFDIEGDSIDFDEFQEWLGHVADTEGTSRRSVLNDLVSTYWILNELTEEIDPEIGTARKEQPNEEQPPTDVVEAIRAVAELFDNRNDQEERTVDPDLLRLIETTRRPADQESRTHGFDLLRLEQRLGRTDDRLSDVATELETVRSELTALSERVETTGDWDPNEVERRQDAIEEVVSERIDWLEEKVDALYLELLDAIEDQSEDVSHLSVTMENVEEQTSDLASDLERERRRRQREGRRLREEIEGQLETAREETDDRLQTLTLSFQGAIDEIEEHLHDLYDRDDAEEERLDELVAVLDESLTTLFTTAEERTALEQLLEEAQQAGIRTATCRSCERSVDLDLLTRPACPHCDRVFSGIETERSFLRRRHELTTRIPGYQFDVPPLSSRLDQPEREESGRDDLDPDIVLDTE